MEVDRQSAEQFAATQVERVGSSPRGRLELLEATYRRPGLHARKHLPFRRAAVEFMQWQLRRGVLEPLDSDPPGSAWWRAVNARLLLDGCTAVAIAGGRDHEAPTSSVQLWLEFIGRPSPGHWYRAHNASIVGAYLANEDLAYEETVAERFFINVALLRVLYAHSLVGNSRLALGRCAPLGRMLGDPRLGMAGAFLSLGRVVPGRYPLHAHVERYTADEHRLGRLLDYAVIAPRLDGLYEWSAQELRQPRLGALCSDGRPAYAWPAGDDANWQAERSTGLARLVSWATAPLG